MCVDLYTSKSFIMQFTQLAHIDEKFIRLVFWDKIYILRHGWMVIFVLFHKIENYWLSFRVLRLLFPNPNEWWYMIWIFSLKMNAQNVNHFWMMSSHFFGRLYIISVFAFVSQQLGAHNFIHS